MSTASKLDGDFPHRMTLVEYRVWERQQSEKHEYSDAQVYAQAGASLNHNRVVRNIIAMLERQFEDRDCEAFSNNFRLWVESFEKFYYPDVMALCDEPRTLDDELDTICNPAVIFDVSSKSTRGVDAVQKRRHYRTIPELREYLLVDQYSVGVERLRRIDNEHWDSVWFDSMEQTFELASVNCVLRVSDIYRKVKFGQAAPEPDQPTNEEN